MRFLALLLLLTSASAFAQKKYISGFQKVTFRTGPGTENKIIKMLESDTAVSELAVEGEWTKVKDQEGTEGYVLTRFLDEKVPYKLKFNWLQKKYDNLQQQNSNLKKHESELSQTIVGLKKELSQTQDELQKVAAQYSSLRAGSKKYLELKSEYEETKAQLTGSAQKINKMEEQLSKQYILWFLAGASVLFMGWLIGLSTRKKKGYGSQIRL